MDAHDYKIQEYQQREKLIYEQIKQENASLKQELNSISYRMDEAIRGRDQKIKMMEESKGIELKKQKEQFTTIIEKLQEEKKGLNDLIELRDNEIKALKEIEANIAPSIEELKESIDGVIEDLPANFDDNEEAIAAILRGKLDTLKGDLLTEIGKIGNTQADLKAEIARLHDAMANLPEPITDIDLQNIKIEIENSISQKLDEKIQYLDEGMNGMIDILKEHIDSMPKQEKIESLKEAKGEVKEAMQSEPVVNKINDEHKIETELEPELVTEKVTEKTNDIQSMTDMPENDKKFCNTLDKPKSIKEIALETGISERSVYKSKDRLIERRIIESDNGHPEKFKRIAIETD